MKGRWQYQQVTSDYWQQASHLTWINTFNPHHSWKRCIGSRCHTRIWVPPRSRGLGTAPCWPTVGWHWDLKLNASYSLWSTVAQLHSTQLLTNSHRGLCFGSDWPVIGISEGWVNVWIKEYTFTALRRDWNKDQERRSQRSWSQSPWEGNSSQIRDCLSLSCLSNSTGKWKQKLVCPTSGSSLFTQVRSQCNSICSQNQGQKSTFGKAHR